MKTLVIYPSLDNIPTSILAQLTKSAILVYRELSALAKISSRDGSGKTHIVPSQRHLAERTGYSERTVHTAVHKLKVANLIDHIHRINTETGKRITNLYYLARKVGIIMRVAYRGLRNVVNQLKSTTNKYYNTSITGENNPPILGRGGLTPRINTTGTADPPGPTRINKKILETMIKSWIIRK